VKDVLGLVFALGYRSVHAVVGHDFGSPVAAYCALVRPDVFRSVVLMSAPFAGPQLSPSLRQTILRQNRNVLMEISTPTSRLWLGLGSIINGTTRRGRRTGTCCILPEAFILSSGRTTITRAPTGLRTSRTH
jgi:pimeloyl-ACP methyl ester carboxylesterase